MFDACCRLLAKLRIITLAMYVCGTVTTHAETVDPIQSRAAAAEALNSLAQGDRRAAIQSALSGLPPDPGQAEIAAHPQAWSALWRAVAAKIVRLDTALPVSAAINPDGTRMLVASAAVGPVVSNSGLPLQMIDTATGAVVGTPISPQIADSSEGMRSEQDLVFSPDGRFAAASLLGMGAIAVFDGFSGEVITQLGVEGPGTIHLGFSHDSRLIAATDLLSVVAWDAATGVQAFRVALPEPSLTTQFYPLGWAPDNRILVTQLEQFRTTKVLSVGPTGAVPVVTDLQDDKVRLLGHAGRSETIYAAGDRTVVFDSSFQVIGEMPPVTWFAKPVREGGAIASPRMRETMSLARLDLDVYGLNGEPLEVQPSDFGRFNNFVLSTDGTFLGLASATEVSGAPYAGQDIPIGPELYQMALTALSDSPVTTAMAPGESTDLATLKSVEFARVAQTALRSGERSLAIIAALKGLPANPQEDDFETFAEAHQMLFRAVAARAFRFDGVGEAQFGITIDGKRAVVGLWDGTVYQPIRAFLYDAESGEQIAEFIHPSRPEGGGFAASATSSGLSPDGQHVLLMAIEGDRISVFRTSDGEHVRDLIVPSSDLGGPEGTRTFNSGFSIAGDKVAVQNGQRLFIFDFQSSEVITQENVPELAHILGWRHDDRLYFRRQELNAPVEVLTYQGGAFSHFTSLTRRSGAPDSAISIEPSAQSSHLQVTSDDETQTFYDRTGQRMVDVDGATPAVFVRQGAAIAVLNLTGDALDPLQVLDLTGAPMATQFSDYLPFDSALYDENGTRMSYLYGASPYQWDGAGVQRARALYNLAWDALPEPIKAEIEATRVQRP